MSQRTEQISILLVDDNEIDVMAFQRGMTKHRMLNPLTIVSNGREALETLRGTGGREAISRPCVIFLDMNMPVMNGQEFLDEVAKDETLGDCTIFVLTTSEFDESKLAQREQIVSGYLIKSNLQDACLSLLESPRSYWRIVEMSAVEA